MTTAKRRTSRPRVDVAMLYAATRSWSPDSVTVRVDGMRLVSVANRRECWAVRQRRVRDQREAVRAVLITGPCPTGTRWSVTITRSGPGAGLDTDNLAGAAKAVRDEIAAWLGVDDGPSGPVSWAVEQRRGPWAVEIGVRGEGTPYHPCHAVPCRARSGGVR